MKRFDKQERRDYIERQAGMAMREWIVLLHFTSCPTFDDVTTTLMGVRDWLTHHRYHRRHRCPTFDDVTATPMGVRDDVMTGNHYKVQKDYSRCSFTSPSIASASRSRKNPSIHFFSDFCHLSARLKSLWYGSNEAWIWSIWGYVLKS